MRRPPPHRQFLCLLGFASAGLGDDSANSCLQAKEVKALLSHLGAVLAAPDHHVDLDRLQHVLRDVLPDRSNRTRHRHFRSRSMFGSTPAMPSQPHPPARGTQPRATEARVAGSGTIRSAHTSTTSSATSAAACGHWQPPLSQQQRVRGPRSFTPNGGAAHSQRAQHAANGSIPFNCSNTQGISSSLVPSPRSPRDHRSRGGARVQALPAASCMSASGFTAQHMHTAQDSSYRTAQQLWLQQQGDASAAPLQSAQAETPQQCRSHSRRMHERPDSDHASRSSSRLGSAFSGASSTWSTIVAPLGGMAATCARGWTVEPHSGGGCLPPPSRGCNGSPRRASPTYWDSRGGCSGAGASRGLSTGGVVSAPQPNFDDPGPSAMHSYPAWDAPGHARCGAAQGMRLQPELQRQSGSHYTHEDESFLTVGAASLPIHWALTHRNPSGEHAVSDAQLAPRTCMTPMQDSAHDSPEGISRDRIAAYHVGASDSEHEGHSAVQFTPHSAADTVAPVQHACSRVNRVAATWDERVLEDTVSSSPHRPASAREHTTHDPQGAIPADINMHVFEFSCWCAYKSTQCHKPLLGVHNV